MSTTVLNNSQAIEITDKIDAILSVTTQYSQETEVKKCLDTVWEFNYNLRAFLYTLNLSTTAYTPSSSAARDNETTIGTRIRQLRKDQGITAADLAHMIGEHEDIITQWESDIGEPVLSFAIPLCQALRCDLNWLITGEGSNVKPAQPAPVNVMKGADLANIGVRIESRRNEMGMSPLKLAEKIDTSGAMILEWEAGKAIPHSGYIDKLAKALNTTVTWLITGNHITDKIRES
ncbi:helix-turn-helix domain-containing protein [Salmonella enterica]|uniref:helix-turn-helix domain-containing protein n=1 Tax=Salmonella enterica TaxID=28901 RepID=UPI003D312EA3|nr:helix-turn-helix domain-containing protein [Salmonella enterica]